MILKKNKSRRLNFLLIMPRLVQSVNDGYVFPLGIPYISSSLKKAGFNVFTLNLNHKEGEISQVIKKSIKKNNIKVVATGGLSPQYHLIKSVIESVKKVDTNIVTVVGGGIISAEPKVAMKALEYADFGIIGEGELSMCELAEALESKRDFTKIDGIIIKRKSGYIKTKPRQDIKDISAIPWPDYEGFDVKKYLDGPSAGYGGLSKKRTICMLGSRSCPYLCTFCFHTNGSRYRQRSIDDFFAELDYLVNNYKIEYISMADELFAPDIKRAKEFCGRMKKYGIKWHANFRIDRITPEMLSILKDSGLDVMFFGLESADNTILKSMRKGNTIETTERVLKMVYDSGIPMYGCFIFGDIEETYKTANKTLKWWREHPEYFIHLTLIKPYPGTYIYKYARRKGIIKDPIQYLKDGCPQINISKLSDKEFSEIVYQTSEDIKLSKVPEAVKLLKLDPRTGRETISGICSKCKQKNIWEKIKLFAIDYIHCSHCGQKYDIPYPIKLRENIDKNVSNLLKKYGKVAIWGMIFPVMDLFKESVVLQDKNVYPIDISESKNKTSFYGKTIKTPMVIEEEKIPVVIVAVPSHFAQISSQVRQNHPNVKRIIDICLLVGSDYDQN